MAEEKGEITQEWNSVFAGKGEFQVGRYSEQSAAMSRSLGIIMEACAQVVLGYQCASVDLPSTIDQEAFSKL